MEHIGFVLMSIAWLLMFAAWTLAARSRSHAQRENTRLHRLLADAERRAERAERALVYYEVIDEVQMAEPGSQVVVGDAWDAAIRTTERPTVFGHMEWVSNGDEPAPPEDAVQLGDTWRRDGALLVLTEHGWEPTL